MHKLNEDCWMCRGLLDPPHLIFFQSPTSVGKLNPDQFFTGYSFVTLKWHEEELYQLTDRERKSFLEDMSTIARTLSEAFQPDKMNYELLGNGVPHLHWHLIPRFKADPFWGRPIWTGQRRQKRLSREEYEERIRLIESRLRK